MHKKNIPATDNVAGINCKEKLVSRGLAYVHRTELLMNDFQYLRTTNGLHLCIEQVIVYLASVVDILPLWYLQTDIATTSSL